MEQKLILDAYSRIEWEVHGVLDEVSKSQLEFRTGENANTIAWLIWHLSRVMDDHISNLADTEQIWMKSAWNDKFDLPFDDAAIGYGQSSEEVAQVKVSAENLRGYFDDVYKMATKYLETLKPEDYDEIIDENWDPPVTRGVRIVSVLSDCLQHVGQAAFIKGL